MNRLRQFFLTACCVVSLNNLPALDKGEMTVEYSDGDSVTYSDVEIHNTENILYLKSPEINTIMMISKNTCSKEGQLLVCDKARLGLDTEGVLEELKIKEIHLFINPTNTAQQIQGSEVTLSPGTVLLEVLTEKGTYMNALGRIDSTSKPEGASR